MSAESNNPPQILLAGVPFGRDNVGDEAIIECVVNIVRELCPEAELHVSTDDETATGKKLNVKTYPLFGFDPPGFDREQMRQAIADADVFIWSGATGLSDYPDIPLEMLDIAQQEGTKSIIFCTGKNDELNPSLYRLLPGKRRMVFDTLKLLTAGILDLSQDFETKKTEATNTTIKRVIPKADLVILRDAESKVELEKVMGQSDAIHVGADPAITLTCPDLDTCRFPKDTLDFLERSESKIGLCISAQSPVKQIESMIQMFDGLIESRDVKLVGIPMNPITDAALLEEFRQKLKTPDAMHVIQGVYEPDEINAAASKMDVVISSRLHLLILASVTLTPFIGISRGTKVTNFTRQFDLPDTGSVEALDMDKLRIEIERLLDDRPSFRAKAKDVRLAMMARLNEAKSRLRDALQELGADPQEPKK